MMPLPIAVWRCSCEAVDGRDEVLAVRASAAAPATAVPAKVTMPTRDVRRQLLHERLGGLCAAAMRLGSTSVARI